MHTYLSTFVSGLQEPVELVLKQQIPRVEIINLLDGCVVYKTDINIKKSGLRCFNNSFLVVKRFDKPGKEPMKYMLQTICESKDIEENFSSNINHGTGTFRVIASCENRLIAMDRKLLKRIEMKISKVQGLRVDRSKPDVEFWFLYRREGIGFFMVRVTRHTAYEKILHRGELRPELAYLLCFISQPNENDIFLDPFCGYGAVPVERALSFPYKKIYATDKDENKIKRLKKKIRAFKDTRMKTSLIAKSLDALYLDSFENNFFDTIVTDPPWGLYKDVGMSITQFYSLMFSVFYRVLKVGGMMVVVTARKEELEYSMLKYGDNIELLKKYNILVSGKKASIYKIIKRG